MEPILVTGAVGRHGGTGRTVARMLREQGVPVRALVRRDDDRADHLRALGAEIVIADLCDRNTLVPALEGLSCAYFTYPVAGGIVEAAATFAAAGRTAGLRRIVVMSMAVSRPDSPSHLGRNQWLAEEVLGWAGFSVLALRVAALFVENLQLLHGAELAESDVIRNSFGDTGVSWMSGEDAARLAVAALLHPERFPEGTAVYPSGGSPCSYAEIARLFGDRRGRPLRHETISGDDWCAALLARVDGDSRINPDMARHIATLGEALRQWPPENDLFERVTGTKPTSVADIIASGRLGASR